MYIIERKKHRHVSTWAAKKGVGSIGMHLEKKVIFKLITFFFLITPLNNLYIKVKILPTL